MLSQGADHCRTKISPRAGLRKSLLLPTDSSVLGPQLQIEC